jgi:hypothetical protein
MSSVSSLDRIIQSNGNNPNEWKNILNLISQNPNE